MKLKNKILCTAVFLLGAQSIIAQNEEYTKPTWFFGVAGGANMNFFTGTTQQLSDDFTALTPFHKGYGTGLFIAPLLEYHKPNTVLGFMFQAGLDSRRGSFKQVKANSCGCPEDLKTDLSYITIEPSLRVAPFKGNFYMYGGPRVAFNVKNSYDYQTGINPAFPNQEPLPAVEGEFSNTKDVILSMQIGMGYDVALSSQKHKTQWVLSPFVAFHPYFGQNPRSSESWSVSTLRAGAALKFGRGSLVASTPVSYGFSINSPDNSVVEANVRETFPLRNYVFFDLGSTAIPARYVLLQKNQVAGFKENQLDAFKPKNLSGRSARSMTVYYNILNILGDRMQKNPAATINLVGSSEKGAADGRLMAQSIKDYLVNIFGINQNRIAIEGNDKPKIPSEKPGAQLELELLRAGDRRVSIESNSPDLLMEFQSGPGAPLRGVEIAPLTVAPESSYVTLSVKGAEKAFTSWTAEVKDVNGKVKTFGPYTQEEVKIPGKDILGTKEQGDYKITLVGTSADGKVTREEQNAHVVLWKPSTQTESMRFSVIYEFNSSDAIAIYEKYLTEVVAPKIPVNGNVIINGFTDIIGDETNNAALSTARANDVKQILQSALAKSGRTDVTFKVTGNGENLELAPFGNGLPEERFYNRTVVIDVIPTR